MNVLGIDVGGAHLKLADLQRRAHTISFPLWKQPQQLTEAVRKAIQQFDGVDQIALTMTGELADCYASKAEGVTEIVSAVVEAADPLPVEIWQTAGEFVSPEVAVDFPELTAASNWLALASWAARAVSRTETGILLDIGSTTVDIIPLMNGQAVPTGRTDLTRLQAGELVYTGGKRTPVCAVCQEVQIDQKRTPLAAEWFATMEDVFLLLGETEERSENCNTADGRPADRTHAAQRLARMVCCDATELSEADLLSVAAQIAEHQQRQIHRSLRQVLTAIESPPDMFILSGSSEFIARKILQQETAWSFLPAISLAAYWGQEMASAACAFAVAQLASEQ